MSVKDITVAYISRRVLRKLKNPVIIEQSEKRAIGSLFRHRFSGRSVIVEDE